ncbi:variable large family protein (plasmid) [Borrelia coriaceae]|uniref:Variable large protein n=1 Tax=Borrelia coriaceae ATCC 43381 TaxID=1408429 RepID=W5T2I8_9SPIR|nr:variable large family protein [Borrelia coriaceae]AHH11541.1 Variable outer membrane protein [Borrelia coriaceae ATCC 43381]UPA17159.1 variable large family protein [Borrelia coriaceae]
MKINIKNIRIRSVCATLFISLFLSCNNGVEELQKQKQSILSISNLRQDFLDVFASFGDMVTDTLGIKAQTKKEDIGKYFTKVEQTMTAVKVKLNDIIEKYGKHQKVKEKLNKFIDTISKIELGAKEVAGGFTGTGGELIGSATKNFGATVPRAASINTLVKGVKAIVEIVLKKGEGNPEADVTIGSDGGNNKKDIGKLFSQTNTDGTETSAAKASAAIGAVTGAYILRAIANSGTAEDGKVDIDKAKNAAELAVAKKNSATKEAKQKDAVIAAEIALIAMAKDGKFAANNDDKDANAVTGAVASAVNKTISTLIIAIRNTVDSGLKIISEARRYVNRNK